MNDPIESDKPAEAGSSPVPCSAFLRVVTEDRPHWLHLICGPKSVSKVELKIDNQSFLLDYEANGASDAEWMAYQLAIALRKAGVSVRGCGLHLDPAQCCDCGGPLDNGFMACCKPCSIKRRDAKLESKGIQYTGEVPCRECGQTHWMHGACHPSPNNIYSHDRYPKPET